MEQPGVSKLVAVKFADSQEEDPGSQVTIEEDDPAFATASGPELEPVAAVDEQPADDSSGLPAAIQERLNPGVTIKDDSEN
ncbi:MAG: hypothetical protein WAU88_04725, partial [Candidatus Zixiibacteriota bacterium]